MKIITNKNIISKVIILIILSTIYLFGSAILELKNPWITFLALAVWALSGLRIKEASNTFLGALAGLIIAFNVTAVPFLFGELALAIPSIAIVLIIVSGISGWLSLNFIFSTFLFMAVGLTHLIFAEITRFSYPHDLMFGTICFWIVPLAVMRLRVNKLSSMNIIKMKPRLNYSGLTGFYKSTNTGNS